jgi:pre-mRNA-splicing factor ATP-dependent RNA helicase DHX16
VKNPQTVQIHPSSGLAKELPRWVVYFELVFTTKAGAYTRPPFSST